MTIQLTQDTRFLADEMLGKVARWLRLIGYDAEYARDTPDEELRARAVAEDRVLLTRDAACARAMADPPGVILLRSRDPDRQLEVLVQVLGLPVDESRILTRCSACNGALHAITKEAVADRVPEGVLASDPDFLHCAGCDRVYWEGTHVAAIRERVQALAAPPAKKEAAAAADEADEAGKAGEAPEDPE